MHRYHSFPAEVDAVVGQESIIQYAIYSFEVQALQEPNTIRRAMVIYRIVNHVYPVDYVQIPLGEDARERNFCLK